MLMFIIVMFNYPTYFTDIDDPQKNIILFILMNIIHNGIQIMIKLL